MKSQSPEPTILFGYFCVENAGVESILLHVDKDGQWHFPIDTDFGRPITDSSSIVDGVVLDFCKKTNVLRNEDLLQALTFPVSVRTVLVSSSSSQKAPALFTKVRLQSQTQLDSNNYAWIAKKDAFQDRQRWATTDLLDAINRDHLRTQFGFNILECIDALVFRIVDNKVEFLLMKRRKLYDKAVSGWEYPKGAMLYHETPLEAALRELEEETSTGVYVHKGYLGYQIADVSERRRSYNTVKVHGLTFLFEGSDNDIVPTEEDFDETPAWVSLDKAQEMVWMRNYGPEFYRRWHEKRWEIIGTDDYEV